MQGQNWNGATAEQQQQQSFNPPFFNSDGQLSQEAMQSMFQGNVPNELANQAFTNFDPNQNFSHPSQMMMSQHSGMGAPPQRFIPNMGPNSIDPAASAAVVAVYGPHGYNGSASAPGSRRRSQKDNAPSQLGQQNDTNWMPDYMQQNGADANGGGMSMRAPINADFRASMNGYEPDGPSSNGSEDSAQGKRRRMTFGGAPINPAPMQGGQKPILMHHDSSSGISDLNSMGSTPMQGFGPDGQPTNFTRPPFHHRRSRSGSELAGPPGFGQRSFSSIELGTGVQDAYGGGLGYPQPPSIYPAGQQHSHSFVGSQALSALGGHAASHPPGLGSQILRGVDVSASGSSAATDFTKRKGWTGRVVEELLDFVHVLDPDGTILFASPSVQGLTGWKSEELKGRKLTEFVHPQDVASVEREIDRMRSSKGELLTYYRFKTKPNVSRTSKKGDKSSSNDNDSSAGDTAEEKERTNERRSEIEHAEAFTRDGDYIVFEATGHPYFPPELAPATGTNGSGDAASKDKDDEQADDDDSNAASKDADSEAPKNKVKAENMAPNLSSSSKAAHPLSQEQTLQTPTSDATSSSRSQLQCFFCSARPYPSKNTSMLDSFLELKLENEKLRLLIADMDLTGPDHDQDRSFAAAYHPDLLKQELENEAMAGGWAHTVNPMFGAAAIGPDGRILQGQQVGQRPGQASRQNSIGSHPTSPLMRNNSARDDVLAGLGVSAGDESDEEASASQNNAGGAGADGAANAADDARRKKKPKQDDGDHVCTDCGRVDSPEWRKGPLGPKTLCNACGLRWAKKIKRKGGDPNLAAGSMMVQGGGLPPAAGVGLNVGMGAHMIQPGHSMPHGHPHPFNRADSGQLQGIQMAPPGSMPPAMNMQGMMAGSPNGFANRGSFDGNPHQHQGNGMNGMGGGNM
ncbi:hypothetical protein NDA16_000258 [Ustilago loliicola]|nr:hypothetical protein NDA16_000258 [Ustilago loliicola]